MKVAMNEFCEKSIKHLNVITDSPTSHSKGIFWLIKVFCEEFGINVKWIYLERGHGKGIPDGLGVTVKKTNENLLLSKPSEPKHSVADLLNNGLEEAVLSISIYN